LFELFIILYADDTVLMSIKSLPKVYEGTK
jgi:hypothetical protein